MSLTIHPHMEQRSEAWYEARRGIVTASAVGQLVSVGPPSALSVACPTCEARPENPCVSVAKGREATALKSLHDPRVSHAASRAPVYTVADTETSRGLTSTLIAERVSGLTEDMPMMSDMWRGVVHEPFAREAYARNYGEVDEVGFMVRTEDAWTLGYSPDGLVGDDGLIEIKCPRAKTHLRTILADEVPAAYMPQLQAGLLVSGRAWIDFVSFVAGMPLYRKRVWPDANWVDAIVAACIGFEFIATETAADYFERVADMPATEPIDNELGLVF